MGKDNIRRKKVTKTAGDRFIVMDVPSTSFNKHTQQLNLQKGCQTEKCTVRAEEISEGEKSRELSLSFLQTVCLALHGVAELAL